MKRVILHPVFQFVLLAMVFGLLIGLYTSFASGQTLAPIPSHCLPGDLVPIPSDGVQIYRRYYATPIRDAFFGRYRIGPVQPKPQPRSPIQKNSLPDIVALTSLADSQLTEAAKLSPAVCRVSIGSAAGSGTLIAQDDKSAVVLTAEHVVGRSGVATCTFRDGTTRKGQIHATQDGIDAAIIVISPPVPTAKPIPIAKQDPPIGSDVLAMGYGGGWKTLWAAATKYAGTETWQGGYGKRFLTCPIVFISGDSGGLVSYQGELVGVIEGYGSTHGHGPNVTSVRTYLAQYWPECRPCPPLTPRQRPDRIPVPPAIPDPSPPDPQPVEINYDKLLDLMAKDGRFRGPEGPAGKDGANGKDGLPGAPGQDGKDGADGAPGQDGESGHVTVRIVTESGEELYRLENLKPNTEVDLPLRMRQK